MVSPVDTSLFKNTTRPAFIAALYSVEIDGGGGWDSMKCLKASLTCGFSTSGSNKVKYITTLQIYA
ncbi:hypothetical protein AHAS_Ahas03G0231600 [Arachis hypogaea]